MWSNDIKCKYMLVFPLQNLARKELNLSTNFLCPHKMVDENSVVKQGSLNNNLLTHWGRDKMATLFPDDIFKCISLDENIKISIKISRKFDNNIPALVLIMAWRRSGNKPLSEPMVLSFLTHICVARPQWVDTAIIRNCHFPYTLSLDQILHS